jgi:hypothetical protein
MLPLAADLYSGIVHQGGREGEQVPQVACLDTSHHLYKACEAVRSWRGERQLQLILHSECRCMDGMWAAEMY